MLPLIDAPKVGNRGICHIGDREFIVIVTRLIRVPIGSAAHAKRLSTFKTLSYEAQAIFPDDRIGRSPTIDKRDLNMPPRGGSYRQGSNNHRTPEYMEAKT